MALKLAEAFVQLSVRGSANVKTDVDKAKSDLRDLQRQAQAVFSATRTPEERFTAGKKGLEQLRDRLPQSEGGIDDETFQRAHGKLIEQFERESGVTERLNQQRNEAVAIIRRHETAADGFLREQTKLNALLNAGEIDVATYNKELARLATQYASTTPAAQAMAAAQQRGAAVTRQNETAGERWSRELRELDALYRLGTISSDTYTRAQMRLRNQFIEMSRTQAQAVRGSSRMNMALQQASFGIQDFVQVIGPMGLSGALRASANNMAQTMTILNPAAGIYGGLAITLASIGFASFAEGARDSGKAIEESNKPIEDRIRLLTDLAEAQGVFRRNLAQMDESSEAQRELERLTEEREKLIDKQKGAQGFDQEEQIRIAGLREQQRKLREEMQQLAAQRDTGTPGPDGEFDPVGLQQALANRRIRLEKLAAEIKEAEENRDKSRANISDRVPEIERVNDKIEEAEARIAQLQKEQERAAANRLGMVRQMAEVEARNRRFQQREEFLEKQRIEGLDPRVQQAEKIKKDAEEQIAKVRSADFLDASEKTDARRKIVANATRDLEDLLDRETDRQKSRTRSFGSASVSGLQSQIQQGLFPKDTDKAVKDTAKNTKDAVDAIKDVGKQIKNLDMRGKFAE